MCPRPQQPATQRRDGGQPNASPPDFPGRSGVSLHSLARPSPATPNVPERPRECQLCMEQPWASGFPPSPPRGLKPCPTPSSADHTPEVALHTHG